MYVIFIIACICFQIQGLMLIGLPLGLSGHTLTSTPSLLRKRIHSPPSFLWYSNKNASANSLPWKYTNTKLISLKYGKHNHQTYFSSGLIKCTWLETCYCFRPHNMTQDLTLTDGYFHDRKHAVLPLPVTYKIYKNHVVCELHVSLPVYQQVWTFQQVVHFFVR